MSPPTPEFSPAKIVCWQEAALPEGMSSLVAEAVEAGFTFMKNFPEDWRRRPFLDSGEGLFLVLSEKAPVAMAVISADPHVPDTKTGRLRYIYVAKAMRRRGLSRALVEACLQRGASNWQRLRLHTENPVAARLYEGYGFVAASAEVRTTHVRGTL